MRLLKWLFYAVVALAAIVVGGSFLLPPSVTVTRSIDIAAPPETVFAIISDLDRFNEFSPWADLDPAMEVAFEGPPAGVGQTMRWSSSKPDVGNGSQTIVASDPPNRLELSLVFGDMPPSLVVWMLTPTATGTRVDWSLTIDLPGLVTRWFGLLIERQVGPDFERGLVRLKAVAAKP